MKDFELLREFTENAQEERLDEVGELGGIIGLGLGVVIIWLVGELSAMKQDRRFSKEIKAAGGQPKPLKAFPIARQLAGNVKSKIQAKVKAFKSRKALEKLESDPDIKAFLSTAISGQSFKKGKRAEFLALLKKKSNPKVVKDLEVLASDVRDEVFKRSTD